MDTLKFIDLFAGIGGFRIGFERAGYKCVFSAEIDDHACEVYKENFGDDPKCDITQLDPNIIPDFDVLCAGFPCQSFSISGKQKGFYDEARGTLFFDICRILEAKKPKVVVLENVQNLEKHDKGNTLRVIIESLTNLGYTVNYKVLNAKDFDVPQNRERIIIIGNRMGKRFNFDLIETKPAKPMKYYLDKEGEFEFLSPDEYTLINNYKKQKSGLIFIGYRNKKIRTVGVRPNTEHLSRVHKQPNRIYSAEGMHPTLASQETSGRYWIYVDGKVRKLTLNECFRFMGFPEDFKKIGPKSELYKRIGNSVCVNMVEAIAKQIKLQFFNGEGNNMNNYDPMQFLENIYKEASEVKDINTLRLNDEQLKHVKIITDHEETLKGVFTVLVSSLTYKCLHPEQDVRYHKAEMEKGYSGRTFDTKYVTPFLKSKQFYGAMKESGWLTRSLEQPHPFDLNFPGKISNKDVKKAFLQILNDVEVNKADAKEYLKAIFTFSLINKSKKAVKIINPLEVLESELTIDDIMNYLKDYFEYKYSTRGASILPVVAVYSIYQCMIEEFKRFEGKKLDELASHNSCDRSSGATGDIVVRNIDDNEIYEVVEVKFDIDITEIMVQDAYNKIMDKKVQRYYILSTKKPSNEELLKIKDLIYKIRNEHGCQFIVNGLYETIKYYLRLFESTDKFIEYFTANIQNNTEINFEHKIAWNNIIQSKLNNL